MQFKHPEILYGLLLLIIPIIIHLFHFQKFTKVPFTNVKFLKKIEFQSRKSSKLKKWLILLTRLMALASVIIAFSQPYISEESKDQPHNTLVYIDNSLSMSAKIDSYELLKNVAQQIIENLNINSEIYLFTNTNFQEKLAARAAKNELLNLDYDSKDLNFETVFLHIRQKLQNHKNSVNNVIIVSDFQKNKNIEKIDLSDTNANISLVQIKPTKISNIAVDSLFILDKSTDEISIKVLLKKALKDTSNVSISLFNDLELLGKATGSFQNNLSSEVTFKIPFQKELNGRITIDEAHLDFDNSLFFNISKPPKIKVLSIGKFNKYLPKLFPVEEFDLEHQLADKIDFNRINDQHLIVLNELDQISDGLISSLKTFENNGGSIVIIPSIDGEISSYNKLLKTFNFGLFDKLNSQELNITTIHFEHPVFQNVFEKKVQNFEYPKVNQYFTLKPTPVNRILSLENGVPFLSQSGNSNSKIYLFNSPLTSDFSNFYNTPIIVPIFYNIGLNSYKFPQLYYTIGHKNLLDVAVQLKKDQILKLQNDNEEIIPLQQVFTNKVEISTTDTPSKSGFYNITNESEILKTIAFNYNRNEGKLEYSNLDELFEDSKNIKISNSVEDTFSELNGQQEINSLFRWFLSIAVLFLLIEILILKFFKI